MPDLTITVHYDVKEITEGNKIAAASFTEVEKSASKLEKSVSAVGKAAEKSAGGMKSLTDTGAFSSIAQEAKKVEKEISTLRQAMPEFIGGMMACYAY